MEELEDRLKARPRPNRFDERVPVPRLLFKKTRQELIGTQLQLATDLGLTEVSIRKIEKGSRDPSFFMSFVYALYLGVSVHDLFPDIVDEAKSYLLERGLDVRLKG